MPMSKFFCIVAVIIALRAGQVCVAQQPVPAPQSPIGRQITTLPVQSIDGQRIDIAAQPGWKVVYFFSSVCKCVRRCEQLSYLPLAAKYAGRVSFYAVDSNWFDIQEAPADLQAAVKSHHLPYPVMLDISHQTMDSLGAVTTPQAFLLDPNNRVVFAGMPDNSSEYILQTGKEGFTKGYLADALAQALAGKPVANPTSKSFGCAICPTPPK